MGRPKTNVARLLAENVMPIPECGCMIWMGSQVHDYGQLSHNFRTVRAHKASYELANGPVPKGLQVLHKCDVRLCVNPEHLYAGTHNDNMRDRQSRDRQAKGERCKKTLRAESVLSIRERHRVDGVSYTQMAKEYGVSDTTIHAIINRRTWKHI